MSGFWHSWWAFAFLLVPLVIGLSGMAVLAYITYRYYDRIITAFPNSRGVRTYNRLWSGFGFSSRCSQVANTASFVLWPKIQVRRGELDPEEVRNFPAEIKRLMAISACLISIGGVWFLLAVGLLKFSE